MLDVRFAEKLDRLRAGLAPFDSGMYEIDTGKLRPYRRDDLVSKTLGWSLDAEADVEYMRKYYRQVFPIITR